MNAYSDPDLVPRGLGREAAAWQALAGRTRYIGRWIETAGFAMPDAPRLTSAATGWLAPAAGPGWIAVGDAAASFDPLSAHGITTALWSGIQAPEAVDQALHGVTDALERYAERVRRGIGRYRAERAAIYGKERRFSQSPFWLRRHGASVPQPL